MQTTSTKRFKITLITKDLSSRPATIETDGTLPETIVSRGKFFRLNLDFGQPYLYQQVSGEFLAEIEVRWQ